MHQSQTGVLLASTAAINQGPDVRVAHHGTIAVLYPMSADADAWVNDNLPADRQEWNGGIVCDHRCLPDIVEGMRGDALTVGEL